MIWEQSSNPCVCGSFMYTISLLWLCYVMLYLSRLWTTYIKQSVDVSVVCYVYLPIRRVGGVML